MEQMIGLVEKLVSSKWAVAVAIILLVIAMIILTRYLIQPGRSVDKIVRRLSPKYLKNFRIPDGLDGYLSIDYLILSVTGAILIAYKTYDGAIYGSENLGIWRQVTRKGSFEFPNPLKELKMKANALNALLPELEITGLVIFGAGSHFPKNMPVNVKQINDIYFSKTRFKLNKEQKIRWQDICRVVRKYSQVR